MRSTRQLYLGDFNVKNIYGHIIRSSEQSKIARDFPEQYSGKKEPRDGSDRMSEKTQPVKKWRSTTVQLAKWVNKGKEDREFSSYTIGASYFDKETKEYKDAKSFSVEQLQKLRTLIEAALIAEVSDK